MNLNLDIVHKPLESHSDLNSALELLGLLQQFEAKARVWYQEKVLRLASERDSKLRLTVGEDQISCVDLQEALRQAIGTYVHGAREHLFAPNSKTCQLGSGSVQYRQQPDKIEFAEGVDEDLALKSIPEQLTQVKRSLNKHAVKVFLENGWEIDGRKITVERLQEMGIKVVPGQDKLSIQPQV